MLTPGAQEPVREAIAGNSRLEEAGKVLTFRPRIVLVLEPH